jgi:hypothetical protein
MGIIVKCGLSIKYDFLSSILNSSIDSFDDFRNEPYYLSYLAPYRGYLDSIDIIIEGSKLLIRD